MHSAVQCFKNFVGVKLMEYAFDCHKIKGNMTYVTSVPVEL